jgi:hypothetical protein
MKYAFASSILVGLLGSSMFAPVQAQNAPSTAAAPQTRAQVKMERDEFLKTHRWDLAIEGWVLKSGVEPPTGVRPRAEVKAERDAFLRVNRWNAEDGVWVPIKTPPRDLSTRTRAEVQAETKQFLLTHEWNEETGVWAEKPSRMKKK